MLPKLARYVRVCLDIDEVGVSRPWVPAHPESERKELMIRDVVRHLAEQRWTWLM